MEKPILVSACLAGIPCRYDRKSKPVKEIVELVASGKAIPFCPEVSGNLSTPREPSEIKGNKIYNRLGEDLTAEFSEGAKKALEFSQMLDIDRAVLKENSPSCGKYQVYDGTFTGKLINGSGITADKLMNNGIEVLNEEEFLKELKP